MDRRQRWQQEEKGGMKEISPIANSQKPIRDRRGGDDIGNRGIANGE